MFVSKFRGFVFAYTTAFALIYVVVRAHGLALFTAYPAQAIVLWGMHRSRDVGDPAMDFLAPEMFWYGWTASAAIGALVIGLVVAVLPDRWCRFGPQCAWIAPVVAMIVCVYLTLPWFRL